MSDTKEIPLPPGCHCDPAEWMAAPDAICNDFLPIVEGILWCAYCGHDKVCHERPAALDLVSDTDLIRRWLSALHPTNPRVRYTRQAAVQRTFGVGSTAAAQVCRRHGFNPDERVRTP